MEVELADGRIEKSPGIIQLQVEVLDETETITFCVFEELGNKSYDIILGYNFLIATKLLVDAGNKCFVRSAESTEVNFVNYLSESPTVKRLSLQFLQQVVGGGVRRHQSLLLMQAKAEESEIDLSNWEYSWSTVPWEQFDICDPETQFAHDRVLNLLRKYECLLDTVNRPMGGAKVEPFHIELLPGTKPKFRSQHRYSPKEMEFIQS